MPPISWSVIVPRRADEKCSRCGDYGEVITSSQRAAISSVTITHHSSPACTSPDLSTSTEPGHQD